MGAVTAIMYGDRDPTVAGMVLDSPFSSLKMLVEELVKEKVSLPGFILNQALNLVKSTVSKKAKFKLEDIEPIEYAKRCFIPALFVAANNDNFVRPHHAKILHDNYPGDKNLVNIEGDHNSVRPKFLKDSATIFFYNTLQVEMIKDISDNYAGFNHTVKKEPLEENPDNCQKNINLLPYESIESYNILEDEEEVFNKILELSKKEYEDNNLNQSSDKKEENVNNSNMKVKDFSEDKQD